MNIVGIDPGQRHVGLCFNQRGEKPLFHEITTGSKESALPMLESKVRIFTELREWISSLPAPVDGLCVEKQLSVGAQSSSLMFYMMMSVLEALRMHEKPQRYRLAMPLPIQLTSYMKKVHGVSISSASDIVQSFRDQMRWAERISQHKVDAFYLSELGRDVFEDKWKYTAPSREAPILSGRIEYGYRS